MSGQKRGTLPTRVLGKTDVRIPLLGFGTAPAGVRLPLREAIDLYEQALEFGVSYFDTAPEFAGYGKAQQQLGYLLKARRHDVFLVTKCYEPYGHAALRLLKQSLKELQTDYADLVFVHSLGADKMDPRIVFSRHGVYPALMQAKAQGLTRFVGLSGHNRPGRFEQAIHDVEVDVLLNAVNVADRHTYNFEGRVWSVAMKANIGLIAMKVFGGKRPGFGTRLSHSLMPSPYLDLAFRYALSLPGVASAAIGMATRTELRQNVRRAASFVPLSQQETRRLSEVGKELAGRWGSHLGAVL